MDPEKIIRFMYDTVRKSGVSKKNQAHYMRHFLTPDQYGDVIDLSGEREIIRELFGEDTISRILRYEENKSDQRKIDHAFMMLVHRHREIICRYVEGRI